MREKFRKKGEVKPSQVTLFITKLQSNILVPKISSEFSNRKVPDEIFHESTNYTRNFGRVRTLSFFECMFDEQVLKRGGSQRSYLREKSKIRFSPDPDQSPKDPRLFLSSSPEALTDLDLEILTVPQL